MFLTEPVKPKFRGLRTSSYVLSNQTLVTNRGKRLLYDLFYQAGIVLFPLNIPVRLMLINFSGTQIAFCSSY